MKLSELEARLKEMMEANLDARLEHIQQQADALRKQQEELVKQQTDFMGRITAGSANLNEEPVGKGIKFARMVRAIAHSGGNRDKAVDFATELWGKESEIVKGLVTGIGADGGFLVPTEFSNEVIELLRARSIVRSMGPRIVPMTTGVMDMSRIAGGATSEYLGEATAQNASQPNLEDLRLVWKKLRTTVPLSNELIQTASPQADQLVLDDMIASMATREDIAFIRDTGSLATVRGIRHWVRAANVTASAAADDGSDPLLSEVETDLRVALGFLEDNNVQMINPGWMMSPRSRRYISFLRGAQDAIAFPDMRQNPPSLLGFPAGVSNNILNNLGGNSRESELYLVDFADVVIGELNQLQVTTSQEATYTDSTGTLVSAFDRDETVIKAIAHHDMIMRHDVSGAVITDIPYGA